MRHVACDGSHSAKDHKGRNQIASHQLVRPARSVEEDTHKRELGRVTSERSSHTVSVY